MATRITKPKRQKVEMRTVCFKMPAETTELLDSIARRFGVKKSVLIRIALYHFLALLDLAQEEAERHDVQTQGRLQIR